MNTERQVVVDYQASDTGNDGRSFTSWFDDWVNGTTTKGGIRNIICPETSAGANVGYDMNGSEYFGTFEKAWHLTLRYSSYGFNGVLPAYHGSFNSYSKTPFLLDGTINWVNAHPWQLPATDLYLGTRPNSFPDGIASVNLPRHGNRPRSIPRNHPETERLPGGVNVGFLDGHAEMVKLDNLWFLDWYKGYQVPDKRPGLP